MVSASITDTAQPRSTGNIFSPFVDLLTLAGVSILFYAICQGLDFVAPFLTVSNANIQLVLWLAIVVNQPHYTATYFRVYRSWKEVKRYALVSIWLPAILLGLSIACFFAPQAVTPWFCKAYFLTVAYHYAGQTYGIALILSHKAGIEVNRMLKICYGVPIYSSALVYLIGDEVILQRNNFLGVTLPFVGFPSWSYLVAMSILVLGVMNYLVICFLIAINGKKVPLIVHAVILTQLLWFTAGLRLELFTLFVPFFHCLQYLMITIYFRFQELAKEGKISKPASVNFFFTSYFWQYYAILVVFGLIFFNGLPALAAFFKISSQNFAYVVAFSFLNLHHFLLDGEIWKLRKPEVGSALLA